MKLAGYDFEGPFTKPEEIKDLPGVYVVLNFGVLDVGESGHNFRSGGQCVDSRLRTHNRKKEWDLAMGNGNPLDWKETLAACDEAFLLTSLEDKCKEHGLSYKGDKKELCTRLYKAGDMDVINVISKSFETLRSEKLSGHKIDGIAYAVHYEPDDLERQKIEDTLRKKLNPPCGTDAPSPFLAVVNK